MKLRFEHGPPDDLETLHPAYFALIMATGIVSLATHLHGVHVLSVILFWLNAFFLFTLIIITGMRILRYPRAFAADLHSHARGVGFFTVVAAFGVFGSELVIQMEAARAAILVWIIAAALWLVVTYGILASLTIKPDKPSLSHGITGSWHVIVVATQSVSILTVLILPSCVFPSVQKVLIFIALMLWLNGGTMYLWVSTLIFFRYTFLQISVEDLTPHYWINMGAAAISTLAGATLLGQSAVFPVIAELESFLRGSTLLFCAIASWWIPLLVLLGIWRHVICNVPFSYSPLCWGGIFPLGMYSVSTYQLMKIMDLSILMPLSEAFMVISAAAWLAGFVGLIDSRLTFWRAA